jgi:tetratricopeptide (TPR) repeat protein
MGPTAGAVAVDPVVELVQLGDDLLEQLQGEAASFREDEAIAAFESALYEVLLGHDREAAERFWVLEGSFDPGTPLHSDAQWYLASSLSRIGLFDEAERRLGAKVANAEDPFRVDAVRLLLDLYARRGRTADLDALAKSAEAMGLLGDVADVRYALGKGLFDLSRDAEADRALYALPREHPDWARATYVRGAAAVRAGDLGRAASLLEPLAVSAAPDSTYADVRDLALIAMARIAWERDDLAGATTWYARVPDASPHVSVALSESAWLSIAQAEPAVALRAVEVALLRSPTGADSLDLVSARGTLLMALDDPAGAAVAYADALAECAEAEAILVASGPDGPAAGTWVRSAFDADADVRRARASSDVVAALRGDVAAAEELGRLLALEAANGGLVLRRHRRIRDEALSGLARALDVAGLRRSEGTDQALVAAARAARPSLEPGLGAAVDALLQRIADVDAAIADAGPDLEARSLVATAELGRVAPALAELGARSDRAWTTARQAALDRLSVRVHRAREVAAAGTADAAFASLLGTLDATEDLLRERQRLIDAVEARYEEVRARVW